jgi:hypothetical protein
MAITSRNPNGSGLRLAGEIRVVCRLVHASCQEMTSLTGGLAFSSAKDQLSCEACMATIGEQLFLSLKCNKGLPYNGMNRIKCSETSNGGHLLNAGTVGLHVLCMRKQKKSISRPQPPLACAKQKLAHGRHDSVIDLVSALG